MNKKALSLAINIVLYAAGFPVLFIIALVKSLEWNSYGMYGASSFAPLIAVVILAALTLGVQALVYNFSKNRNGMTVKLLVIPIAIIVGIFGILDVAMPPLLKDATSNTILYEDVVNDYQGVQQKLYDRVELFKQKNGLDESVTYQSEEFQAIFKPIFESMDKAYNAFDPLAIQMALDSPDLLQAITSGNFPISVAATLMLNVPTHIVDGREVAVHDAELLQILLANIDKVLAALPEIMTEDGIDVSSAALNKALNAVLVTKEFDGISWNIFNILGSNMIAPEIDPNAQIVRVTKDKWGTVTDTQIVGAALGYQDMAWLNGIPLMFFIPLMSMREIMYLFAGLIAIFTVVQCCFREDKKTLHGGAIAN